MYIKVRNEKVIIFGTFTEAEMYILKLDTLSNAEYEKLHNQLYRNNLCRLPNGVIIIIDSNNILD